MNLKNSLIVLALLVSGAAMLPAEGPEMTKPGETKFRPTHEALMKRRAEAAKKASTSKDGVKTVRPGDIKYVPRKKMGTLIDRSAILCSGGNWTIVPKEAVIHIPPAYQARVNGKRSGKLVPWQDFFAKNRGWIHTHSVSIAQARGDSPMVPEQVDTYKRLGRVVVAVCHNGPISVKPPKVDETVAGDPGAK
jgi:hypothetical protein